MSAGTDGLRGVVLAVMVTAGLPMTVTADEVEELSQRIGQTVGAFEAAALYLDACAERDPEGVQARRDLVAAWRHDNDFGDYSRVMTGIGARIPELEAQIGPQRSALATEIARELDAAPQTCGKFAEVLAADQFDVKSSVRRLMSLTRALDIAVPDVPDIVPATRTVEETQILPLAALSARIEAKMAEIGSKAGARELRGLRAAREAHAEDWLEADGVQVLYGRVTGEDELREWREDMQSSFAVRCSSFSEAAHEARMESAIGRDMVVVGTSRSVSDGMEGGVVRLDRCSLFTVAETARPMVEEEDSAGLMIRPLEFDEAFAGPNAGIALDDVDRVIYDARFDNRLDGFGNGYVDRQEDIYVLLDDGSAYLHEWSFPFTDLDVALSRQREPGRWFTWQADGDSVRLTMSGGWQAGTETLVEGAQRLVPFTHATLDGAYDYLQIGMGGSRQDRRYAFSRDGALTYSRSGFVAGNVGTSYIIVSGSEDPATEARYRIEDFALIIDVDGTSERRFFALPASADDTQPDTVLIEGTAYWLDD
ncbi:hypothetical protein SAMN06295905_0552 [Devosia lucknowensis]|uniref:Uncharacterized protein n=1 Tax=Devosia lucknowensis TaxID=1096929 RepID=A0A1Y6EGR6_9HYPH|nr:hypothetical protein [Devosia lucknowensis]SMQ61656.1 hypothetical protein SAMN06295905_0552 [Devosia lucknowensis]